MKVLEFESIFLYESILVTQFYKYIEIYWKIFMNILIQNIDKTKIDQILWKY